MKFIRPGGFKSQFRIWVLQWTLQIQVECGSNSQKAAINGDFELWHAASLFSRFGHMINEICGTYYIYTYTRTCPFSIPTADFSVSSCHPFSLGKFLSPSKFMI